MSLFNGVENFTPAFTGQQIANQTGSGAAQAFTSGMNAGTHRQQSDLSSEQFSFEKKQYDDTIKRLDYWTKLRKDFLESSPTMGPNPWSGLGDWNSRFEDYS